MKKAVGVALGVVLVSGCSGNLQNIQNNVIPNDDLVQLRTQSSNAEEPVQIIREPVRITIDSKDEYDDNEKADTDSIVLTKEKESEEPESKTPLTTDTKLDSVTEDEDSANATEPESNQTHLCNLSLDKIFYDDYYDKRWPLNHTITWFTSDDFTEQESLATEEAINMWDTNVDSIQFLKVDNQASSDLYISYGSLNPDWDASAYWQSWWYEHIFKSTITLESSSEDYYSDIDFFTNVMLHEVGNVLGLGDIDPKTHRSFDSVMLDTAEFYITEITDLDKCLIQKHYNEGEYVEQQ